MGQWALIEGGGFSRYCGQLVDGTSLVFGGIGPRQAQTVPMDLRDARFGYNIDLLLSHNTDTLHYFLTKVYPISRCNWIFVELVMLASAYTQRRGFT